MLVQIAHKDGTDRWYTAKHVIFHEEDGKDSWVEVVGDIPLSAGTCFLFKGLASVVLWDHGRVMWIKKF